MARPSKSDRIRNGAPPPPRRQRLVQLPFWLLLCIIFAGGAVVLGGLNWFFPQLSDLEQLPFAIRSPLEANYSGGSLAGSSSGNPGGSYARVDIGLVVDVIRDQTGAPGGLPGGVLDQLNTPVPSVTPSGLSTTMVDRSPTAPVASPFPSSSPTVAVVQSATLASSATVTRTAEPTPTHTIAVLYYTNTPVIRRTATNPPQENPTAQPTNPPPPTQAPPTSPPPTDPPPTSPPPAPTDYPAPQPTVYPPP